MQINGNKSAHKGDDTEPETAHYLVFFTILSSVHPSHYLVYIYLSLKVGQNVAANGAYQPNSKICPKVSVAGLRTACLMGNFHLMALPFHFATLITIVTIVSVLVYYTILLY